MVENAGLLGCFQSRYVERLRQVFYALFAKLTGIEKEGEGEEGEEGEAKE
ncbi:MAG: hypothetical protein V3U20_00180 [Thermoplasmata archaeon]